MRSLRECDIEVRMAVGRRIAGDGLEQAVFLDGEEPNGGFFSLLGSPSMRALPSLLVPTSRSVSRLLMNPNLIFT